MGVENQHVCVYHPSLHTQTCQARVPPRAEPSLGTLNPGEVATRHDPSRLWKWMRGDW